VADAYLAKLRASLGNIIGKIAGGTLETKYSGRIPEARIFRREGADLVVAAPAGRFKSNQTYFQVVVNQLYVSQDRRLWVEREHLGAVWMGFRYDGAQRSVPFVVGRDLLVDRVNNLPQGARIEFLDVRVGKIYPYSGEGLALYLGLWSTPTIDWATGIFGALDTIASKLTVAASLSQALELVDVLNQGMSTVLGLNAVEAHLNLYQEFQDPSAGDVGVLQPGYFVIIDAPGVSFDASGLQVIDGRLHIVRNGDAPKPFFDHDFLLFSIVYYANHPAATDMFEKQYENVLTALISSKSDPARLSQAAQEYHSLQSHIVTSPDLTRGDKNALIAQYSQSLNTDAVGLAVNLKAANVSFAPGRPTRLPPGLPRPTQAEFEAVSAHLADGDRSRNPAVAAGQAAAHFGAAVAAATGARAV